MASLFEYFLNDGNQSLREDRNTSLIYDKAHPFLYDEDDGRVDRNVERLHLDYDANAKFISLYIPGNVEFELPDALERIDEILEWPQTSLPQTEYELGQESLDVRDLTFTGRVYIYSERRVPDELKQKLIADAKAVNRNLVFRSKEYAAERNKWEKPRAFISHDSRDKSTIAQPLASQLMEIMCPVWFDEFTLKVGDSLRESIEKGLKECPKCIVILTPNFLRNERWTKREFDTAFTRELIENQKVILPVWHGVSPEDVYKYSPILADRVGVQWSKGKEEVARRLSAAINI